MAKLRVWELAKKIGRDSKVLLKELQDAGYSVKAIVSMVEEDVIDPSSGKVVQLNKVDKKEEVQKKVEVIEEEKLKVVTQIPKKEGGRAVFRVSKPLTKIKEDELLPVHQQHQPPVELKEEKVEEKKEEKVEEIIVASEVVVAEKVEEKLEPKVTVEKQPLFKPKIIKKARPEKEKEESKVEEKIEPIQVEKMVEEKEEVTQEITNQQVKVTFVEQGFPKKRKEEIRKVVLPKAPPKEVTTTYPHRELPKKEVKHKEEEKRVDEGKVSTPAADRSRDWSNQPLEFPNKNLEKTADQLIPIIPAVKFPEAKKKSKRERRLEKSQAKQEREEKIEQEFIKDQEKAEKGEAIFIREGITVKELAEKINVKVKDIISKFMMRNILLTINQPLDPQLAIQICSSFGYQAEVISFEEELIMSQESPREGKKVTRAPIVTVMGHVDHGKSSLLEAIHNIEITSQEFGGITQHIGAYKVKHKDREFVFLDTPGHEAFTMMRARGAKVTDIVILVVAADDGVMPQTVEAINHCKAAKVPIIVAINKIDKPDASPDKVKRELMQYNIVSEEVGGDTVMVPISAKKRIGIDTLLDMVSLTAEMMDLKAVPDSKGTGTVLEAKLDKNRGPVATVLVQDGTVKIGDIFLCGSTSGRVRQLYTEKGEKLESAPPSTPVEILGFTEVPSVGSLFQVVESEAIARQVSQFRREKEKEAALQKKRVSLENVFGAIKEGEVQELSIIVKGDVQGSVEAISNQLAELSNEEIKVKVVHSGVGAITESDVLLASASDAIVIGFNVRADKKASDLAKDEGVDIRTFTVIYSLIDNIRLAMKGLLKPIEKEIVLGHAEVKDTFKISGVGTIAGAMVTDGKITRNSKIRILRDNVVIYESSLKSLKRFKDDASEVKEGLECGIGVENFNDIKVGDVIEAYETTIEERNL